MFGNISDIKYLSFKQNCISVTRQLTMHNHKIPVIDLFAGPGGLGEGFSAYTSENTDFNITLSIEKDAHAHKTLELRSFFRKFPAGQTPEEYYEYVRGSGLSRETLFEIFPEEAEAARQEAWHAELGNNNFPYSLIDQRIQCGLGNSTHWVLIGGPPCQAYSMAGRKNILQKKEALEEDERQFLYKEYLRIIREHRPSVFVMENVKGLLSSKHEGNLIFERIREDLSFPWGENSSDSYSVFSLVQPAMDSWLLKPEDFIIKAEDYGIPQKRHRVILLGVLNGGKEGIKAPVLAKKDKNLTVRDVIQDIPALRSRVSRNKDSYEYWRNLQNGLLSELQTYVDKDKDLESVIREYTEAIKNTKDLIGGRFVKSRKKPKALSKWYFDPKIKGVLNHETRSHIPSDLHRYFFAACYTRVKKTPPKLPDFPEFLLPDHKNAQPGSEIKNFTDRFRVQAWHEPSNTIVSHISKDGHYYIHPDPAQCRSMTVREAARIQTFPDNYFFEGNRTQQYIQVGNAVPPYLAYQIADIVKQIITQKLSLEATFEDEGRKAAVL